MRICCISCCKGFGILRGLMPGRVQKGTDTHTTSCLRELVLCRVQKGRAEIQLKISRSACARVEPVVSTCVLEKSLEIFSDIGFLPFSDHLLFLPREFFLIQFAKLIFVFLSVFTTSFSA